MDDKKIAESILQTLDFNESSKSPTTNQTTFDLKDKIIQFERTQKMLKQSIVETDVALKSPQIKYRETILQSTYQKQKLHFESFCLQFKHLTKDQRRPYETMFRKFKQKIIEHQDEIRLALEQPSEYKKKLENTKQVWFENQQTEEEEWKFLLRGLLGILGAFMLSIIIGAGSRYILINQHVSSFYKLTANPYLDVKKNAFVAPLQIACVGMTLKLGLKVCNAYGPIKIIVISFLSMAVCVFTASFMEEYVLFILFNNVLYGLCSGMIFLSILREPHKYFPKYKLISNAFILMGSGLGQVMFGVLNRSCMNPHHQALKDLGYYSGDQDYIAFNLPVCWRFMTVVLLMVGAMGTTLFYRLTAYNRRQEEIMLQRGEVPDFENSCYTDEEGLKSPVFLVLAVLVVGGTFGNYYLTENFRNYVKAEKDSNIKGEDYLIYVHLTGQLTGAFCSLFWGLLFRSIGFKYVYIIASAIDICVYTCMVRMEFDEASFLAVMVVHFVVQSGWMVIFSNACLLIFGDIIGESIYAYCWALFALTNLSQYLLATNIPVVSGFINKNISPDILPTNSYQMYFYPAIAMNVICIVVCSVSKLQGRWENSLKLLTFQCQ